MDTKLKEGEQLKSVWNKRFSDWTPNEIFCPRTANDIQQVVQHFKENEIPFVVRSGGHSGSGKSSINGGGLISLHNMKNIDIDDKNQKISFETGCTLGDLDTAGENAQSKNYTPWGTVSFTGAGGLILHGGMGLLSKKYGLSIDNIVELELVTENGTVVVNQNSDPELFWACRGGASLFGIATRVTMQTHHIPYSYGGTVCTINDELSEYIPHFIRLNKDEPDYSGYLYLVPTPASLIILNMSVVTDADKINVLQPFLKGPIIYGQFSEQSVWQINKSSADFFAKAPPVRQLWKSVSIDNDENILEVLNKGLEFIKNNRLNEGSVIVVEYWTGKMSENNGHTCYNRRHKGCTLSFFFGWQDPTQDEHFTALITRFIASLTTSTESSYINTNPGTSNCFDQQSRDRLLALKAKWDPKGIFSGPLRI